MDDITKRERVSAALRGVPVDRVPASVWWRESAQSRDATTLATLAIENYRTFDWDWIVIAPPIAALLEAWGTQYHAIAGGGIERVRAAIRFPDTLMRLRFLDPRTGPFGEQLEAIRLVRAAAGPDLHVLQVVPSPLTTVGQLMESDAQAREYMLSHPEKMASGLSVIAETLSVFATACLEAGADGVMLDLGPWAAAHACDDETFAAFARPYDLQVLTQAQEGELNVVSASDTGLVLARLLGYPIEAIGWDATLPGNPSIAEAAAIHPAAAMAGLGRGAFAEGSPEDVAADAEGAISGGSGRRLLLAPGVTLESPPSQAKLEAVRSATAGAIGGRR